MSRRFLVETTALLCVLVGFSVPKCLAADAEKKSGANVFGATRVWKLDLEFLAAEYKAMQPPAGGFGPPAPPAQPAPKDKRDSERNLFGTEFRWAE